VSNFAFIKTDFSNLFVDAQEAEQLTFLFPKAAAIFCRSTLENAINWLYNAYSEKQLFRKSSLISF